MLSSALLSNIINKIIEDPKHAIIIKDPTVLEAAYASNSGHGHFAYWLGAAAAFRR